MIVERPSRLPIPNTPEEFLGDLYPSLVAGLSLHVGELALSEDLAQQALLRAWLQWDRLKDVANPTAWVWRVALNLASSHFRRFAAQRRAVKRMTEEAEPHLATDFETGLVVRNAIRALPPRQRSVLVLRYFADLSVGSTAEALGIAEGTVKATAHQAIERLRGQLGVELFGEEPGQ